MYKDVENQKCLFCEKTVTGNQRIMLAGRNLPSRMGRTPNWLKEMPEYLWAWNGLSEYINGERVSFDFYLCPSHQSQSKYKKAFKWAQEQIDGQKALASLLV